MALVVVALPALIAPAHDAAHVAFFWQRCRAPKLMRKSMVRAGVPSLEVMEAKTSIAM